MSTRETLYGRNAALECLRARRRHIHKVILADNVETTGPISQIIKLAKGLNVPIQQAARKTLDKQGRGHQGVLVETGRYPLVEVADILSHAARLNEPPFLVALDHIEDPHNVGAIIRTLESVGAHGLLLPKRRSAGITATVVNVSAGATEHIRVAEISNLVQTLKSLKAESIWVMGLEESDTAVWYHDANLSGPVVLVIGNEGKGLSRLVRETCDLLIKLPMRGHINSLNASVAGALALYEVWRARDFANKR